MVIALSVGAVVCISIAIAGDTSQDLKTGFLIGATPWKQQIGEFIGVLTSAIFVGWVILRLHKGVGIGSEELPAPQATLMSLVVKGVITGDLPWRFVIIGIFLAAIVELVGIRSLPFAVGVYLPLYLTTPIMAGGLLRHFLTTFHSAFFCLINYILCIELYDSQICTTRRVLYKYLPDIDIEQPLALCDDFFRNNHVQSNTICFYSSDRPLSPGFNMGSRIYFQPE
jgi:hypothetical protein